jgi:hypothetical protein
MKPNLTKDDSIYILQYYNIQIPKNDNKIIQNANKYIEENLCKCIKNKQIIYSVNENDELKRKRRQKCNIHFQKTKKYRK